MLKQITLNHYKTFMQSTTISFCSTDYDFLKEENTSLHRILKGALFIGENASGKTNILKSIQLLLDLLFKDVEINFIFEKSFYSDSESFTLTYEFEFEQKDIVYEIELSTVKIIRETLIMDGKTILDRNENKAFFNYTTSKTYEDLSERLLFLRRIYFDTHFYDDKILNQWFDFLMNSIYINCYNREIKSYNRNNLLIHNFLDENGTEEINEFFRKINYHQQIKYSSSTDNLMGMNYTSNDKFVSFLKDGTSVYIPETFESTGNITLIHLLPVFLHSIRNSSLLIIDEFSSGLHNELEECLIKYFFHYSKNSQIFFTSHSTNLLNNTILRPDQIYSVNFKANQGSVLKRFSKEEIREGQNIEKMYLNGAIDELPRYNKIFKD